MLADTYYDMVQYIDRCPERFFRIPHVVMHLAFLHGLHGILDLESLAMLSM